MGQQHLGNATLTTFLNHLRDVWKSHRGTVLRIEALTLVAIALSFFIAAFGSYRRWSNHWILQKGFIAANALFLSLGTYSIGLMQSSSVKSEMYPILAVSLLVLLCCIDPPTASGLDYKITLWKMLYLLCLYYGYVTLMSLSTISSDIGNVAICLLSAVTFMKGFHRSMALVLPSSMRNMVKHIPRGRAEFYFRDPNDVAKLIVDKPLDVVTSRTSVDMGDISNLTSDLDSCKDVCFSFALSHLLQRRFLKFEDQEDLALQMGEPPLVGNYERIFKVVEVELAFLYDIFFTSNAFLHYYEAKAASIWAFASLVGICFVGVVTAIPGTRTNRRAPGTIIADTTIAEVIITEVILVSLAILQVFQLLCCWSSNWTRIAFACDHVRNPQVKGIRWRMRQLQASLIKINLFGNNYLWQNKLGQHSIVESASMGCCRKCCDGFLNFILGSSCLRKFKAFTEVFIIAPTCSFCSSLLGLHYTGRVLREMLWDSKTGDPVELHADVKASIAGFVGGITSKEASRWASFLVDPDESDDDPDEIFICILTWHVATCYCELAQECDDKGFLKCSSDSDKAAVEKDHRVATALSKYCAYLVVSAPQLLGFSVERMKTVYNRVRKDVVNALHGNKGDKLGAMELFTGSAQSTIFCSGVKLGMKLRRQPTPGRWKELAEFWVKALVYAAPGAGVEYLEEHKQRLSQGGELITHLWALLYHAGIDNWHYNRREWWGQWEAAASQIRPAKDYSLEPARAGSRIHKGDARRDDGASSSRPPLSP